MNSRTCMAAWVAVSWLALGTAGAAEPAQKSVAKPAAVATATADNAKATDKNKNKDKAGDDKKKEPCGFSTGSRIRRDPPADCARAPGERTYTADDINRTGEMNVSDALRKLDPRFQ